MTVEENYAPAPDGLLARRNGRYAEDKLRFFDDYLPPALVATRGMHRRHVVDLFAGPGWNVDKQDVRYDFPGSPFRELAAHAPKHPRQGFSHAHLVNLESLDHELLTERVDRWSAEGAIAVPRDRISLLRDSADRALPQILRAIQPLDYVFVFADIEGIEEFPWSMVEELRAHGHRSLELYVLFPLQMTLQRLLSYDRKQRERYAQVLTAFFGSDEWRPLADAPRTETQGPQFRQAITDLYISRLSTRWRNVSEQRNVRLTGSREFYRMIFASDHPAGGNIAKWERSPARSAQFGLGL